MAYYGDCLYYNIKCDCEDSCLECTHYNIKILLDNLESARIYAGAEFERLCNNKQFVDASVFQSIRDNIAQNIQFLQSYINCTIEKERN